MWAFFIIIGLAVIWIVSSGLIYGGFYLLRYVTIIPAERVLAFSDAMEYSETIIIALIIAGVIAVILHEIGVIDLGTLLPDKLNKKKK